MSQPVNFQSKLNLFSEHWSPKVVAEMNDYQFKLVKIQGEFTWHHHSDTDETFMFWRDRWALSSKSGQST